MTIDKISDICFVNHKIAKLLPLDQVGFGFLMNTLWKFIMEKMDLMYEDVFVCLNPRSGWGAN